MSHQTFYFKNFCYVPGNKLEWYKLPWKEFVELKNLLIDNLPKKILEEEVK